MFNIHFNERFADSALEHVNTKGTMGSTWIIQKYIEHPLLLSGRKFDIRSFVLVTPNKQVWLHSESYIRTSSVKYTLDNLDDRCGTYFLLRNSHAIARLARRR
jgi:hypothetical protein